jgi:hypothetical protein
LLGEEPAHPFDHPPRFVLQPRPGNARHPDPIEQQVLLTEAVPLEGTRAAVRLVDVEFDYEPLPGPVDVKLISELVEARDRFRQACLLDQLKESKLQPRARERRRPVELETPAQPPVAWVTFGAREQLIDRAQVEQLQLFGSLPRSSKWTGTIAA